MDFLFKKIQAATISNPLSSTSLLGVAISVGDFLFQVGTALGVAATLYAAILFLTANGNPQRIDKAKQAIVWALVGVVIVLISQGIVTTIKSFFE